MMGVGIARPFNPGFFSLDLGDNAFTSIEPTNGLNTTGTLAIATDGGVDYTGDTGGTNEAHSWWNPDPGVPVPTWHVKLVYDSGTNQYSSGSGLSSWVAVSGGPSWTFVKTTSGTGGGSTVGNYTLSFSRDAGSTTHDSVAFSVTLQEDSI